MARRSMLTAAKSLKTKKIKASKVAQQLADMKHMGDEPDYNGKAIDSGVQFAKILNWYNYMCTRSDAREYIETYLKSVGRNADLKELKKVPDAWVNLQAGWTARLLSRGAKGVVKDVFETRLKETLARAGSKVEEITEETIKEEKPKVNVRERVADRASDTIGELDELIDNDGYTIDVYDWLTKKQIPPATAKKIRDFFKPIADEAEELISRGADKQLVEGYNHMTKAEQKQRCAFYTKLISDCERFADVTKKQKAPRKKKPVPVEKKLKDLKFQSESKEYKVASIKPEKIVTASELWTFNTKYKTLNVFRARDAGGLDVKGTTIINYDEKTSKGYRIGRKTEESLAVALSGGKRAVNDLIKKLTECTLQHRSNENTILLRVER